MAYRVGMGYDVHPFKEGRKLFLGGIEIPFGRGLDGHSDADVLIHAIADALLGTIGAGDIGVHFPNTDPQWKNVRSTVFLEAIRKLIESKEGRIINIDATLIAESPKLLPHITQMKEVMATSLKMNPQDINLKATTNERMGFVGRGEGIAAMAVACASFHRLH